MSRTDVTLVTCREYPNLDPDDQLLANELINLGLTVDSKIWSAPETDWSLSKLCLIRSTWDYHNCVGEFSRWLKLVDSQSILQNQAELVRWNIDKNYLQSLDKAGIKIIPTLWVTPSEQIPLDEIIDRLGADLVGKPTVGLGGSGVMRFNRNEVNEADFQQSFQKFLETNKNRRLMIQPFIKSVLSSGERSLIFFEGNYSHAIRKSPFAQMAFAGKAGETPILPECAEIEFGKNIIAQLPAVPLFARVDIVLIDEQAHLMELELIEPSLYFSTAERSASDLAALIAMKL